MNRDSPGPWNALTDPSRNEREGRIKAFEDAWRRGEAPAVADYLPAGGPERRALLVELVRVDLELRLKAGVAARVEEYLARFPELAGDPAAVVPLIVSEFQRRRRDEPNLSPGAYLERFPRYRDELAISLRATVAEDDPPREPAGPQGEPLPAVPGYEVVGLIGRGGMGVVYKARQESLGRLVALKFLPEECARDPLWLERFRREARTASALNHPNICTIHDTGECAGRPFLSMEMIEGRTLESFVGASPDTDEAVRLCGQAAQALAAAHAAGIVHRDIKPANLMVRGDGLLKVLDFGLARRIAVGGTAGSASVAKATDTGMRVGTPLYMSPEQVRAEPVGSAGDVFSLGLVLYELTTGRHPFAGAFEVGILHAIVTEPPLPPSRLNPEVPASVDALIRKMLSKDPGQRPTAAEVAAALTGPPDRSGGRPVTPPPAPARRTTVGRAQEMAALRAAFESAAAGSGLMLCVTGEPGLGKTTLVEEFLAEPAVDAGDFRVARGRCSERLAGAEAYLPILEMLDSLARGEAGDSAARALRLLAPAWYSQVAPAVAGAASDHAAETAAPSQERLKREFLALLDEVSRARPLILFLDDVHWADASTVDLLAYLGNHCARLRLLLVLTYRPAEMRLGNHPFAAAQLDLERHGVCREISLSYLGRDEVDRYLGLAFPGHHFPPDFADRIHTTTEGNPLFMVDLLRYLRDRGVLADGPGGWALARAVPDFQRELPASVRSLIERKLGQLEEDDRRLLAVGSVQGHEFDAAIVARVLGWDAAVVEERLEALDRAHGLVRQRREQVFPDGTLTPRYQFVHVLYQNALYGALQPTRRAAWSATTAQALLSLYGEGSTAVATELALLFEAARDSARAAEFFLHAAENAARRHASQEAVVLARRGLKLLAALPDTPDRDRQELRLQMTLVGALQATNGYSSPDAGQACTRARALCAKLGDGVPLLPVLGHLAVFHLVREELTTARALMEQCLRLAENDRNSALSVDAHALLGAILTYIPENALALEHCDKAIALYHPEQHASIPVLFGHNSLVVARCYAAWTLWVLGRPDRARDTVHAALALARELAHPVTLAVALLFAALIHWLRREGPATRQLAEQLMALADEHGMAVYQAIAAVWRGWALCKAGLRDEGVAEIREGSAALRLTGAEIYGTIARALLAESLAEQGQADEGLTALADALAIINSGAGRYWEAELHRLQGELRLRGREADPSVQIEAEASFRQALDVARRQQATSLELRAAMSLFRLYRRQDRAAEVRPLLAEAFGRFTEGLDTPDLLEARALLAAPSA